MLYTVIGARCECLIRMSARSVDGVLTRYYGLAN